MMAFADADFVDGDASQMFELGLGKMPLEVAFLNVLDRIPADTEVSGNILDGHALRQFQGVALEGVRVAKTRVGKRELHLPRDLAVVALDARDVEEQVNAFGTDRHQAKQPRLTAMGGDVGRVTNRTAQGRSILFDGEHHSAFEVVGADMAVAAHAGRLIEEAGGHVVPLLKSVLLNFKSGLHVHIFKTYGCLTRKSHKSHMPRWKSQRTLDTSIWIF